MIRLGQSLDGRLLIGSNEPFPADVKRVEYYTEQKLFVLVYENGETDLMPTELPAETDRLVRASPNVMIIAMLENGQPPYGYQVSLVQIGV